MADEDAMRTLPLWARAEIGQLRVALSWQQDRVAELEADTKSRRSQELLSGAGDLLSAFLGGRNRTRSIAAKLNRAASRRSMSSRTAQRAESAENRALEKVDELNDLERELADALIDIDEKWQTTADSIEPVQIGLEKTDVTVDQTALVWIPRS